MATVTITEEEQRAASLKAAQEKADLLFDEIARDLIRPGKLESELSREIHELGARRHGVRSHWHKRTVRSGPNTLEPYGENPPDRALGEDDILFVDLGPVFEEWEADFGRTFVLGHDPAKLAIRDALEPMWQEVKAGWRARSDTITGAELYAMACDAARAKGYEYGGQLAGHIVGDFPHERIPRDKISLYVVKDNHERMESVDKRGHRRHWILEIHLVDRQRQIGGFFEQLLTVD